MISRRSFITLAPAACAALATTPGAAVATGAAGSAGYRPETFEPHLGSAFSVACGGVRRTVTLTEVSPARRQPLPGARGAGFISFSLTFEGTGPEAAEAGIHRITHPRLRPMDLLLKPCGTGSEGRTRYLAMFSVMERKA